MMDRYSAERRITLRLLAYWERIRRDRQMPTEEDINPEDIRDLWDNCFLVHTADLGKPDYNYTYMGEALNEAYCFGLSESDKEFLPVSPHADHLTAHYSKVIESCKPIVDEGEFRNLHNHKVLYRQCLLPLGENGKVVAIFGGMRFKIFVPAAAE